MSSNLSPSQHIGEITAYRRSNCILKCFASRDNALYVRAFVVYVRPILEYNSVVWSPWLKQDIDQIEKVQRRFTERLVGMKDLNYDERMHRLGLPSLELRRLHLDLIFCYKVGFGLVGVNIDDFFEFNHAANTRGRAYKLFKSRSVNNIRHFLLNALLMCGTDCRHLSALHQCQHSAEQYRKLILVSSWNAHDYSSLFYLFIFYFFNNFYSFFLFQINLLKKFLKSFSSSVSLGCVYVLCMCIFVYHCFNSVYYCNCVT